MFGNIEVTLLKTEEFAHYVMRTLQIEKVRITKQQLIPLLKSCLEKYQNSL